MSVCILNTSNDEKTAQQVLAELTDTPFEKLSEFKLGLCNKCLSKDDDDGEDHDDDGEPEHDGPCSSNDLDDVTYDHETYSFPMTKQQYDNAGLDLMCLHQCRINTPRFWIIEVPKGTKRGRVLSQLQGSIC